MKEICLRCVTENFNGVSCQVVRSNTWNWGQLLHPQKWVWPTEWLWRKLEIYSWYLRNGV